MTREEAEAAIADYSRAVDQLTYGVAQALHRSGA